MSGFYVNHLKSDDAKYYAKEIEMAYLSPLSNKSIGNIKLNAKSNSAQDVLSAGYAVLRDHPELFYYSTSLSATSNGKTAKLTTNLLYSLEEIIKYKSRLSSEINRIVSLINPMWTKWEKEKFIFDYLQSTVEYTDDHTCERYNIVGALLEHKAVCEGISKAFAVLCHSVGIPCIVVFSKTHMWNLVNINGTICNVDATYGTHGELGINYTFFNTSDRYMQCEHEKEIMCIPKCSDDSQGYYNRTGTFFDEEKDLKSYLLKNLLIGHKTVQVKLRNGNIDKTINSIIGLIPHSIHYSTNKKANTAIIKAC